MTDKKKDPTFWGYIGKAGVIVALIWGAIQIYSYFFYLQLADHLLFVGLEIYPRL